MSAAFCDEAILFDHPRGWMASLVIASGTEVAGW